VHPYDSSIIISKSVNIYIKEKESVQVNIIRPAENEEFPLGYEIFFEGDAVYNNGTKVDNQDMAWFVDGSEIVAYGRGFSKDDFSDGEHTITLLAPLSNPDIQEIDEIKIKVMEVDDEVIIIGSHGFREHEWNGLLEPNRSIQNVEEKTDDHVKEWSSAIHGVSQTQRYLIGPPPSDDPEGCWLDGEIDTEVNFYLGVLEYKVNEHTHSHYSFCGVNIHHWDTFFKCDFYIRGNTGTSFSFTMIATGDENLTEYDGNFGYRFKGSVYKGENYNLPITGGEVYTEGKSGKEIVIDGITYSYAATLEVPGSHGFGYSNVIQCPFIPWHTAYIENLSVYVKIQNFWQ
ncbi:hypothetical protein MHK_000624, partial [Candidatus Magnetomorum sp. HK-1]